MRAFPSTRLVVAVALLVTAALGVADAADACVRKTTYGEIQGTCNSTMQAFLGIRYAATTGGSNRWLPPQPVTPWTGVQPATAFGPGCAQTDHNPDVPTVQSEDCLFLNVWAPPNTTATSNLPVTLFIHGGTFKEGAGSLEFYWGRHVVEHPVVLVTINYRLGALGWLVTDELGGNYGLMDQRAAMMWTRDNIAAFGGDPSHVTIQGESAGAMSIGLHTISPASKGLFMQAIMESNVAGYRYRDTKEQQPYGRTFTKDAGCTEGDTACLRAANLTTLLEATRTAAAAAWPFIEANLEHILDGFIEWEPTVTGPGTDEVPMQLLEAWESGQHNGAVPTIIGTNTNEGATFILAGLLKPLPKIEYEAAILGIFGFDDGFKVLKAFPASSDDDCRLDLAAMLTDYWFRCPSRRLASLMAADGQADVFMYRYNHLLSFNPWGRYLPMCTTYVCHGAELIMVFGNTFNWTFTPPEAVLSHSMISYWDQFSRTGDPNSGEVPFHWPAFDAAANTNIVFNDTLTTEEAPDVCTDLFDVIGYNF